MEIIDDDDGDTCRSVYTVRFAGVIYGLHALQKKSRKSIATPRHEIELIKAQLEGAEAQYREHHAKRTKT